MANLLGKFILLMLLVLPATILLTSNGGSSLVAYGQEDDVVEDAVEGEDDAEATVETDEGSEITPPEAERGGRRRTVHHCQS